MCVCVSVYLSVSCQQIALRLLRVQPQKQQQQQCHWQHVAYKLWQHAAMPSYNSFSFVLCAATGATQVSSHCCWLCRFPLMTLCLFSLSRWTNKNIDYIYIHMYTYVCRLLENKWMFAWLNPLWFIQLSLLISNVHFYSLQSLLRLSHIIINIVFLQR